MHEVKIWFLTGLLTVLLGLMGWAAKTFLAAILKKMDVLIEEVRHQSLSHVQIQGDVRRNRECIDEHKEKLADHDKRITRLERTPYTPHPNTEL